jgi:RHS repeat-associated protein
LLAALAAPAQQVVTGFPPFSSQTPSTFDTVNNANLNVFFAIPVVSKAGRGMPFQYTLVYNSSVWSKWNSAGNLAWTPVPGWGWGGASSATTGTVTYTETQSECWYPAGPSGKYYYWNIYMFDYYYDPNGTQHQINVNVSNWTNSIPCSNGSAFANSASGTFTDGSGYSYTVNSGPSAWVYPPSGLSISVPAGAETQGSVTDTNGNSVVANTSSGTTTFTDTLGLTALTVSGSGTPSSPVEFTYTGGSAQATVQVNYASYTVQTNFGCSGITEYGPTQGYLVSTISMPDGTTYSFNYETTPGYSPNVTGRLASVTLPTGATISYTYSGGSNGITCQDGSAATLTREVNPGSGGTAGTWTYVHTEGTSTSTTKITDPNSNDTVITSNGPYAYSNAYEEQRVMYNGPQSSGNVMETINTCYNGASIPCVGTAVSLPITELAVTRTLGNVESETNTYYNSYAFVTKVDEYDFGSGGVGAFKRETMNCPYSFSNSYIQNRPQYTAVYNATGNPSDCSGTSGLVAKTTYSYDSNGNLLSEVRTNTGGSPSSVSRSFTYGSYGVMQTSTDFKGNQTTYSNFACGSDTAFPQTITPAIASLAVSQTWNCNGGVLTSVTDPNSQTTSYVYSDPFWRLTEIEYPDGGNTTITYTDSDTGFSVETSRLLSSGVNHQVTQYLDGLGRVDKSVDSQACSGAGSTVTTSYDSLGRVYKVSNPYCTTSDPTYGLTAYSYDPLSRVSSITYPDTGSASLSYSGNCATATDPASKQRALCSDALGRITSVTENPGGLNYQTTYTYDDLNDLTGVAQSSQTRTYNYDMLARLTSATTPEAGTVSYSYAASGSPCSGDPSAPCSRTDARGITTTYAYDALDRLTSKTYSDGTPTAQYYYDLASVWGENTTNAKGRLVLAQTVNGSTLITGDVFETYDPTGRVQLHRQCTPYNCGTSDWRTTYNYDLAGDVTSWLHPGGFTITQGINSAGQIAQVTSSVSDQNDPASLATVTYTPFGAVSTLLNGCADGSGSSCTDIQESYFYNTRLQMAVAELGTSSSHAADSCRVYSYYVGGVPSTCSESSSAWPTGSNNNGNVAGYYYTDDVNALSHTATYQYDSLNRLGSAAASGSVAYSQTLSYDNYGNMSCSANPAETNCLQTTYNTTLNNNQISNYTYDAAGNVTNDGTYSYQWDAEGRLTAVTLSGIVVSMNTYNALGQRVEDVTQSSTTEEAYGVDGALLARYTGDSNSRSFVPFKGRLLAEYYCGGVILDHPDEIGSATTATDCTGKNVQERLYYPFGEFWNGAGSLGMHQEFAQLPDYDPETDQYNTANRHYTPMGRWLSPDPLGGDITNPQSLNRYAYVLNNPTTLVDPLGLIAALCNDPSYAAGDASCGTPPWFPGTGATVSGAGGGNWAGGWAPPPSALTGTLLAAEQAQAEGAYGSWVSAMELTGGSYTEWDVHGPVTYTIGWSITSGAFWIGPNGVVVGNEWAVEAGLPALPGPQIGVGQPSGANPGGLPPAPQGSPNSEGNAGGLQIGRWNISHPSPEVCGDVKKWSIGLMVSGAAALGVGAVFPVVAPFTELYGYPASGAGAVFGIYYAAFCRSW